MREIAVRAEAGAVRAEAAAAVVMRLLPSLPTGCCPRVCCLSTSSW